MNNNQLNSIPLNVSSAPVLVPIPLWVLIFNQQELCAFAEDGISVLTTNQIDLPNFNLVTYKAPLIDNGGVVSHLITDRNLDFEVYIQGDDQVDYENKVQAFKKKIILTEWTLQLNIGSQSLFCRASVTEFKKTEKDAPYAGTFSLKFKSLESYHEGFQTQLSYLNVMWDISAGITNEWHRETELSMTMSFTNAVALNEITITSNWYPLTISETINPWDILYIDGVNGNVQLNTTVLNYDWILPSMQTNEALWWFNPVIFAFNAGSTIDVNITMFYVKQYT